MARRGRAAGGPAGAPPPPASADRFDSSAPHMRAVATLPPSGRPDQHTPLLSEAANTSGSSGSDTYPLGPFEAIPAWPRGEEEAPPTGAWAEEPPGAEPLLAAEAPTMAPMPTLAASEWRGRLQRKASARGSCSSAGRQSEGDAAVWNGADAAGARCVVSLPPRVAEAAPSGTPASEPCPIPPLPSCATSRMNTPRRNFAATPSPHLHPAPHLRQQAAPEAGRPPRGDRTLLHMLPAPLQTRLHAMHSAGDVCEYFDEVAARAHH
eukprot:TRINITY_DN1946_c0_g2_i10.p2 TRINITY_DN1946_c0_g2~~TRINITY_DN1946_c0_g2_i10.p2  ORF type:complete len:265 (+),score=72.64 TRINITY_DN1946_c0_g2_i10:724-1518(+)